MLVATGTPSHADEQRAERFRKEVLPILTKYCFDCHANGANSGNVSFDEFKSDDELLNKHKLWHAVLKNTRANLMPPARKPRPNAEEQQVLDRWIKHDAFRIDPKDPDPGRVTLRRLNRVEYRNTIRDLMGVDYNTGQEFPPDDTGFGFDNIGDVLTFSPLLFEKYMAAAKTIVTEAVPTVAKVIRVRNLPGKGPRGALTFYKEAKVEHPFQVDRPGDYRLVVELQVRGSFDFDPARSKINLKLDGQEKVNEEFGWHENKKFRYEFEGKWQPGEEHRFDLEMTPLSTSKGQKKTSVNLNILAVRLEGPLDRKDWVHPKDYERYFFRDEPPAANAERRQYAREVLAQFVRKAFRRPADDKTLERLAGIAELVYQQPDKTFEQGIAQAMIAVLSSPRFLFRMEEADPKSPANAPFSWIDEYALASRLSYFLWSTMPDEELFRLAERGELRKNLKAQVQRMLKDPRVQALSQNFAGQWLQARDVDTIPMNAAVVLRSEGVKKKVNLDAPLRKAMRLETELFFHHIVREDGGVLDLIDSDYTFLNEVLAQYYGIPGVKGAEMRRVALPKDSPRGGVLTQASVLMVTSNPTRTSPVKRGLFVLENILGTPAPPPPRDVPELEDAAKEFKDREPTVREMLEFHRSKPLCSACHARMDPLGLGLENFNALGLYRETERGQPIDAAGKLITGETFNGIRDLKKILTNERRLDFYRCLTEKLLTYALGRGMEYYDTEAVDRIVERMVREEGRFSALLTGVIESAPFQKRRNRVAVPEPNPVPNLKKSGLLPRNTFAIFQARSSSLLALRAGDFSHIGWKP